MKKIFVNVAVFVGVLLIMGIWVYTGIERNPVFQVHQTTFDGKVAFGHLDRNGKDYTFYHAVYGWGDSLKVGSPIITLPTHEAARLH